MIDEEDEEEILKKKISFKSVLKNIVIIILIIIGALFIYLGIFPDQMTNFMVGFTLICIGTTILQLPKRMQEPLRQTLTILTCNICGITKVRNFQAGDFVFKKTEDNCEKCHKPLQIKQIYSVKLKKNVKIEEKKESPKKKENGSKK
ncbi:MAG: hypothetical protein ACTSU4_15410 [Promethearchaeota archaeon]